MKIDRPIIIALILFAVILLTVFVVVPEYKKFLSLGQTLAEKKAQYAAQVDYYSAISKAYFDLQSRQDDLKKIDDSLPSDPAMGKLVYYLQQASRENGITIKDLFISKSGSSAQNSKNVQKSMQDIGFSLDLLGDYGSLKRFIMALEKSSRIFEISSISFGASVTAETTQSQFQSRAIYNFNLQIKTHSY